MKPPFSYGFPMVFPGVISSLWDPSTVVVVGHRLRDRQLPQSDPAGALSPAQWGASGSLRSSVGFGPENVGFYSHLIGIDSQ